MCSPADEDNGSEEFPDDDDPLLTIYFGSVP